ncbi:MAG: hypothetical protein WCP85_14550 [Mariniphaga sp.]
MRLRAGLRLRSATGEGKPEKEESTTLSHRKGKNGVWALGSYILRESIL